MMDNMFFLSFLFYFFLNIFDWLEVKKTRNNKTVKCIFFFFFSFKKKHPICIYFSLNVHHLLFNWLHVIVLRVYHRIMLEVIFQRNNFFYQKKWPKLWDDFVFMSSATHIYTNYNILCFIMVRCCIFYAIYFYFCCSLHIIWWEHKFQVNKLLCLIFCERTFCWNNDRWLILHCVLEWMMKIFIDLQIYRQCMAKELSLK